MFLSPMYGDFYLLFLDPMQDGQDGHSVTIHDDQLSQAQKDERQRLRDRFMIDHMVSKC